MDVSVDDVKGFLFRQSRYLFSAYKTLSDVNHVQTKTLH